MVEFDYKKYKTAIEEVSAYNRGRIWKKIGLTTGLLAPTLFATFFLKGNELFSVGQSRNTQFTPRGSAKILECEIFLAHESEGLISPEIKCSQKSSLILAVSDKSSVNMVPITVEAHEFERANLIVGVDAKFELGILVDGEFKLQKFDIRKDG